MSQPRYSRQLAGRVEVEFHQHPNRFRRFTWWTALACVLVAGVWLVQAGTRGEHRIYEAGDVSTPHAMFENDCKLCHIQNLAPLRRLVSFSDDVHSVSNEKCIACHVGPAHHANQVPVHGDGPHQLSCAKCHREHEGDEELARVADRHCTDCHADLETSPGSPTFALHVTNFETTDGHPDFKIEELLKLDKEVNIARKPDGTPIHHAFTVVGFMARPGEEKKSWQDKARIRFNHQAHLKEMFKDGKRVTDEDEHVIERRSGAKAGQPIPYPMSCAECHEFDTDRRYMKPINYEKHCQRCHQLGYDSEKVVEKLDPKTGKWETVADQVPHETTDIVRGYLSKVYNLDPLKTEPKAQDDKPEGENPLAELRRGFPGRDFEASFTDEQARKIYEKISEMEKEVYSMDFLKNEIKRRKLQGVLLKENGGCALCHDVKKYETPEAAKEAKVFPPRPWVIVNPKIPDRWYQHSWFRHDSHRMVSCIECHFDMKDGHAVFDSASTGDVLMPKRELCAKCHRTGPAEVVGEGDSHLLGARADCVECHGYHDYSKEDFDGNLDLGLRPRSKDSTATPTGHGSK